MQEARTAFSVIIISHLSALNFICHYVGHLEGPSAALYSLLLSEPPRVTLNHHLTFSPPWLPLSRLLRNTLDSTSLFLKSMVQTLSEVTSTMSRSPAQTCPSAGVRSREPRTWQCWWALHRAVVAVLYPVVVVLSCVPAVLPALRRCAQRWHCGSAQRCTRRSQPALNSEH